MAMLFKRKMPGALVRPGSRFCRTHASNLVETAEVIDVYPAHGGIPHVRFRVIFGTPLAGADQRRLLCLEAFTSRYPQQA